MTEVNEKSYYLFYVIFFHLQEARCGYALLLLATYWCTEAIPISATALIPVFLFPLLGLLTVHETVREYMKVKLYTLTVHETVREYMKVQNFILSLPIRLSGNI